MPHKVWEQTNELEVSIFVMTMSVCDHVCTAVVSILWSGIKFQKRFCKDGKLCEHHSRKNCISQVKGLFSEVSFDYSADLMKEWFPCRLLRLTGAPTPVKPFLPQMLWALGLYIILCFSWPVQQSVQSVCSASDNEQRSLVEGRKSHNIDKQPRVILVSSSRSTSAAAPSSGVFLRACYNKKGIINESIVLSCL